MIQGIFLARFLPEEGSKVIHQIPIGSISPVKGGRKQALFFDFKTMAEYILPRQAFCNRYITICDPNNKYRILGHPVCIKNEKYERNEFMFNFCIVICANVDKTPYEAVVRRLASVFTEMEIQTAFLSKESVLTNGPDQKTIGGLLEIIKEDLNNYNECMIPVDISNTINMKLFPSHKRPPPVKSWNVPISKIKFAEVMDPTWDLTMKKVIDEIDGIKDVRHIANDADVAIDLTKNALQHLLYYNSIVMLDIFLFGNIYAPSPEINDFFADKDGLQYECAQYVYILGYSLPRYFLCRLFSSLCTGRTVKEWLKLHMDDGFPVLRYVDVRRLIQFGVIKGFIYRVHKYAVSARYMEYIESEEDNDFDSLFDLDEDDMLLEYADGTHCFDQIAAEKNMGDVQIMEQLRGFPKGDVDILYR